MALLNQKSDLDLHPDAQRSRLDDVALLNAIIGVQTEIAEARLNLDEVMNLVATRAQELTHADGAAVEMADDGQMVYRAATGSASGHVGVRVQAAESLSGLCVRTRETLRCDDSETDPRVDLKACREIGLRSMIVVPLFHESRSVGVLKVLSSQTSYFKEVDVHTLQLLAGLVGTAVGRSEEHKIRQRLMTELEEANKRLEQLATTDGLTGLANRRTFDAALHDSFALEKRRGSPLSLVMIDIDFFKQYNDTFGHPAGDSLLKAVATSIRQETRAHEMVARYGGEEFAIIMPGSDGNAARVLAERLRRTVETFSESLRPVTISLGIATSSQATVNPEHLLAEADAALYHSKHHGRNRITHFDETRNGEAGRESPEM